ncbi:hypothetical protein HPP92_021635 [Vanilla planifolia]|uniref:Uncharacterized protein n=1 Tax=Vanilla planifolia TaxID=51239 RepID=A0A835Q081_VANPL|nr:hypothetical protein HPP92_021635 [Vanilla planifolia]
MDINKDKPFGGVLKQKSFAADDALKPVILNFEKQNAVLSKIKTRPASNGKSAANHSATNCHPQFYDRRSAKPGTTLPTHSQSSEKPDTTSPPSP